LRNERHQKINLNKRPVIFISGLLPPDVSIRPDLLSLFLIAAKRVRNRYRTANRQTDRFAPQPRFY
jgi:hypothetical protein